MVQICCRPFAINGSVRHVLKLSAAEQRDHVEGLLRFNEALRESGVLQGRVYKHRRSLGISNRYNQLPCTQDSRLKRAALLEAEGLKDGGVLLLGDDDLLSVELCRRGFRRVIVADCDEALLEQIRAETRGLTCKPEIVCADFSLGFTTAEPVDAVVLDPPYNAPAIKIFMDVALRNVARSPRCRVYAMYNPDALPAKAQDEVISHMEEGGFELKRHIAHFNAYRLAPLDVRLLRLAGAFFLGRARLAALGAEVYYASDCYEFISDADYQALAPEAVPTSVDARPAPRSVGHQQPQWSTL